MRIKFPHDQFEGVSLVKQEVSGFILKETFFNPCTTIPKHSHEAASFCIIISGGCDENYERTQREFKPLIWDFFPAGITHSLAIPAKAEMRSFSIEIPTNLLKRFREFSLLVDSPVLSTGGTLGWLLLRLYREYQNMDEASPLTVEGLALEMLAEISLCRSRKTEPRPPHWLEQVKDYLHAHFSESLHLSTLSTMADVHPGHLAREFRRYFHCTTGEYIRRLRVDWACREIAVSDSSLAQIALSTGFSDQSHFSRSFKRQMGVSPAEYKAIFQSR